jgi:hypothetical protein
MTVVSTWRDTITFTVVMKDGTIARRVMPLIEYDSAIDPGMHVTNLINEALAEVKAKVRDDQL